jgi:hypothetical protein
MSRRRGEKGAGGARRRRNLLPRSSLRAPRRLRRLPHVPVCGGAVDCEGADPRTMATPTCAASSTRLAVSRLWLGAWRAGAGGFLCLSREGSSMAGGDEVERRPAVSVQLGVAPLSPSLALPPSWDDPASPLLPTSTPSRCDSYSRTEM